MEPQNSLLQTKWAIRSFKELQEHSFGILKNDLCVCVCVFMDHQKYIKSWWCYEYKEKGTFILLTKGPAAVPSKPYQKA